MQVISIPDFRAPIDDFLYEVGNYFKTEEEAKEIAEEMRERLKKCGNV